MSKSALKKAYREELETRLAEIISKTLAAYDETSATGIGKQVKKGTKEIVKKFLKTVKKNKKKAGKNKSANAIKSIKPNGIPLNPEDAAKLEKEYNS